MPQKPKVRAETEYTYTDKLNNKRLSFTPKPDEVVATFEPEASDQAAHELMTATSLSISRGANLHRGFAVLQVGNGGHAAAAAAELSAGPAVANAIPVLVDGEGLTRYFLPDELTVQFRGDVSPEQAEKAIAARGSHIVMRQRTPGYYTVTVGEGKGLFETIRAFAKLPEVAFAEPSEAGFDDSLYVPDDPEFAKLWGLHNTGQLVNGVAGTADADIDAPSAWDITRGHPEVIVAVIDTGADLDHPDLAANLLPRGAEDWDFADGVDPVPDDSAGHGTHVAGTAAAVDNVAGVIGVASLCRIMPLRVDLTAGMNQNRADAINYVAAQAVAHPTRRYVINCSWKMSGDHAGVHNAIINANNSNVLVVFAAGNNNQDIDAPPFYPSVYSEVVAVAATDQQDRRASFSNFGAKVDVSAPGVNIYSSFPDNTYTFLDGTSMASPHAAGVAALIWSRNRTLSNQQVRTILQNTCDNIDAKNPGFAGKLGQGRVNAFQAVLQTPLPPIQSQVVRKFPFPQQNNGSSSGLTFAPKLLVGGVIRPVLMFLTQQPLSEKIFYLNPTTGAVLGGIDPVANDTIGSLQWDGTRIRVANVTVGAGAINSIHPVTGAQTASIPAPAGRGEGLTMDATRLYYSTISRIWVLNPATGAVLSSFPPPGGPCRGLAFGEGYIFSGNSAAGTITVFQPGTLAVRGTIPAPGGGTAQVDGLAYNPATQELFVANQSENRIYVVKVTL